MTKPALVYLFGLYIDDELASSIRLHIGSKEQRQFPSFETFADILQPKLDAGKVIIDSTRFVADQYLSQLNRELPYATLRICILAAQHFNADYMIATASAQHQAFYRRAFNYLPVSQPRPERISGTAREADDATLPHRVRRTVPSSSIFPFNRGGTT